MPFDMESFLAGLAVGQVLWNPANGSIGGRTMDQVEEDTADADDEDMEDP